MSRNKGIGRSTSRTLRISLIVGVVAVALLVVTPLLISVDQFRPAIEQQASAALGRKVDLGRLHLSLLRDDQQASDPRAHSPELV